jgi:hypothetical protein
MPAHGAQRYVACQRAALTFAQDNPKVVFSGCGNTMANQSKQENKPISLSCRSAGSADRHRAHRRVSGAGLDVRSSVGARFPCCPASATSSALRVERRDRASLATKGTTALVIREQERLLRQFLDWQRSRQRSPGGAREAKPSHRRAVSLGLPGPCRG